MKNILIWYSLDLRTHNHRALDAGIQTGDTILAAWLRENPFLISSEIDIPRMGNKRIQFQNESIKSLEKNLGKLSIPLHIFEKYDKDELFEFMEFNKINTVYMHTAKGWEEKKFFQRFRKDLNQRQIDLQIFDEDQILNVETDYRQIPSLFTQFKKKNEKNVSTEMNELEDFHFSLDKEEVWKKADIEQLSSDYQMALGGENAAISRLSEYFLQTEKVTQYFETRNALKGKDFSTKFSFWLSNGSLSPLTLLKRLNRFEHEHFSNKSTQWIKYELLWSLFFQLTESKHRQNCYQESGIQLKKQPGVQNNYDLFEIWAKGETSNELVNACMKELYYTGFLSNRGRQIAASYLIHDLKVNWTWGAYYFEHHLIDYQSANNWLNWQYIAGVGNDARPLRYFNPEKQAEIYDPEGIYANDWKKLQIQDIKG